jgi:hypothetical protein
VLDVVGSAFQLVVRSDTGRILHARDPHSPLGFLVLGAGAAMATIASFDGVTLTTLEFLSKQGGLTHPALTRVLYDLQNGLIMAGLFGCVTALFLVSVGAAAGRRHCRGALGRLVESRACCSLGARRRINGLRCPRRGRLQVERDAERRPPVGQGDAPTRDGHPHPVHLERVRRRAVDDKV